MPRHSVHHVIARSADHRRRNIILKMIFLVAILEPMTNVPQIYTIYAHRDASGVSITTWILYAIFGSLWLWYAICARQKPIMISATLFVITDLSVVVGAFLFGGKFI